MRCHFYSTHSMNEKNGHGLCIDIRNWNCSQTSYGEPVKEYWVFCMPVIFQSTCGLPIQGEKKQSILKQTGSLKSSLQYKALQYKQTVENRFNTVNHTNITVQNLSIRNSFSHPFGICSSFMSFSNKHTYIQICVDTTWKVDGQPVPLVSIYHGRLQIATRIGSGQPPGDRHLRTHYSATMQTCP